MGLLAVGVMQMAVTFPSRIGPLCLLISWSLIDAGDF